MIVCHRTVLKTRAQKLMPKASSSQETLTDSRIRQTSWRFALRRKTQTRKTVRTRMRMIWTGRRFKRPLYHDRQRVHHARGGLRLTNKLANDYNAPTSRSPE